MLMDNINQVNGRLTWLIHYYCNYRCPYCFYYEGCGWEILKAHNVYLSPSEWLKHWQRFYAKYGRFAILITGGEPFTYPHFIEIVRELSTIHFPINISSNASGELELFIKLVNPEKVSISLSFHPAFDDLDNFIKKVGLLRDNGFNGCINLLAYPPYLKDIPYYISKFDGIGEKLKIIPFRGIFAQKAYPWSYSENNLDTMGINADWFDKIRKKGKYCQAGEKTAMLLPDGYVVRCGQLFYKFVLGNFFDVNFRLLDNSIPCEIELCPCDEDKIFGEAQVATYEK